MAALLAGAALAVQAGELELLDLSGPVPDAWVREAPGSSMRLAQMRIDGEAGVAELVVYYFGPGQGGTVEANVRRWQSQFTGPEGEAVEPRIERFEVAGMPVAEVSLTGAYARGVGMGPVGEAKAGQTLLAAIVESASGKLFLQLHGPSATVAAARPGFDALVRGLHPATGGPP